MSKPDVPFVRVDFRINRSSAPQLYEALFELPTTKLRAQKIIQLAEAMLNLKKSTGSHQNNTGQPYSNGITDSDQQLRKTDTSPISDAANESASKLSKTPSHISVKYARSLVDEEISDEDFEEIKNSLLEQLPKAVDSTRVRRNQSSSQPEVLQVVNENEPSDQAVDGSANRLTESPVQLKNTAPFSLVNPDFDQMNLNPGAGTETVQKSDESTKAVAVKLHTASTDDGDRDGGGGGGDHNDDGNDEDGESENESARPAH